MRKYTERQVKAALEKVRAKSLEQGRRQARDEEDRLLQKVALVVGTRQAWVGPTPQPAPPRITRAFPENPEHHTEGVRAVHAHLQGNPGDRMAHGVYADELDDAGAGKEAALHRYLHHHGTDQQEGAMHALVAAHGGSATQASLAVSTEAHGYTKTMYPNHYDLDDTEHPMPHSRMGLAAANYPTHEGVHRHITLHRNAHERSATSHDAAADRLQNRATYWDNEPEYIKGQYQTAAFLHRAAADAHRAAQQHYADHWEGLRKSGWRDDYQWKAWVCSREAKAFDAAHHLRGAHIPAEHPGIFYPLRPGVREEPNPVPAAEAHRRERVVTAQAMQLAGLPVGGGVTNMPSKSVATGGHHELFDHFQHMARLSLNEDTEIAARYRHATRGLTHSAFVPHQHMMEAASILHEAVSRHGDDHPMTAKLNELAGRLGHGTTHEETAPEIDLAEGGHTAPKTRYSMGRARKDPSVIPLSRGGRKKVFAPAAHTPEPPLGMGRVDPDAPFHFKGYDEEGNELYTRAIPKDPNHRTEAVMGTHAMLEQHLQSGGTDVTPRLVHADALDDAGDSKQAALQRVIAGHMPPQHLADQFTGRNRRQSLRAAARKATEGAHEATEMATEGSQESLPDGGHWEDAYHNSNNARHGVGSHPQANFETEAHHKYAAESHEAAAQEHESGVTEARRMALSDPKPANHPQGIPHSSDYNEMDADDHGMAASVHRHAAEQHRIAAAYHAAAHSLGTKEVKSCGPGEDDPCEVAGEWDVKPPVDGKTLDGDVKYYPVASIKCDPAKLQYKDDDGGTSAGHPDGLNEGRRVDTGEIFDAVKCPPISLWTSPEDGQLYVVDGHKRLGTARRQGAGVIRGRLIEAGSFEEAKHKGEELNEQMGTKSCEDDAMMSAVAHTDACPKCGSEWVTAPRLYPDLKTCQDCRHDWDCTELEMSTGQTLVVGGNGQTSVKAEPEEYPYGRLTDVSTNGEAVCSG